MVSKSTYNSPLYYSPVGVSRKQNTENRSWSTSLYRTHVIYDDRLPNRLDNYLGGDLADPRTQALLDTVFPRYLPNRVIMGAADSVQNLDAAQASFPTSLPLLEQRGLVEGQPTAYVCQHYVCQLPVTDPEALAKRLEA